MYVPKMRIRINVTYFIIPNFKYSLHLDLDETSYC